MSIQKIIAAMAAEAAGDENYGTIVVEKTDVNGKPTYRLRVLTKDEMREYEAQAEDRMNKVMTYLLRQHRFFYRIAMNLDAIVPDWSRDTMCTNGEYMRFNPYFAMTISERECAGVVIHEIMHVILQHPLRITKGMDHQRSNIAADYEINNYMNKVVADIKSRSGDVTFELPEDALTHKDHQDSYFEKIYATMEWDQQKKKSKEESDEAGDDDGNGNSNGNGKPRQPTQQELKEFYEKLRAGEVDAYEPSGAKDSSGNAKPTRDGTFWAVALSAAESEAKMCGQMPGSMSAFVQGIREPEVPWENLLQCAAQAAFCDDYDIRKFNRPIADSTGFILPTLHGTTSSEIVIGLDTSGSIYCDMDLFSRFLGEVNAIVRKVRPRRSIVLQCDTRITHVDEFGRGEEIEANDFSVHGGGGTDFCPFFQRIEEQYDETKLLIVFTDGYGTFPDHAPPYRVIWVDYAGGAVKYPFGEVIVVKAQQ